MVTVRPVKVDGETAIGITTELPKTRVLALATEKGYVMCGIINIPELDRIHPERRIVAARVVGVREVEDLLGPRSSRRRRRRSDWASRKA